MIELGLALYLFVAWVLKSLVEIEKNRFVQNQNQAIISAYNAAIPFLSSHGITGAIVSNVNLKGGIIIGHWPGDWMEIYRREMLLQNDPVILRARASKAAVIWSEAPIMSKVQADMMALSRERVGQNGICIVDKMGFAIILSADKSVTEISSFLNDHEASLNALLGSICNLSDDYKKLMRAKSQNQTASIRKSGLLSL